MMFRISRYDFLENSDTPLGLNPGGSLQQVESLLGGSKARMKVQAVSISLSSLRVN